MSASDAERAILALEPLTVDEVRSRTARTGVSLRLTGSVRFLQCPHQHPGSCYAHTRKFAVPSQQMSLVGDGAAGRQRAVEPAAGIGSGAELAGARLCSGARRRVRAAGAAAARQAGHARPHLARLRGPHLAHGLWYFQHQCPA